MIKNLVLYGKQIQYTLEYKKIKNINLRIKKDGCIYVSSPHLISQNTIEKFLISKSDFILKALEKYENFSDAPLTKYYEEDEVKELIISLCESVYPYFKQKGVPFPEIRFRKMTSRWGSCMPTKGILTFNTNLMYAPKECIDYVVKHEFTHFLQANHQKEFYNELEKICPNWKTYRKLLKTITIR